LNMTRPLRITYPGAIYHIINRGSRRDRIFRRIKDRDEFLARLGSVSEKYGAIVHAYCLMDNHFHLLLETPKGQISSIMQRLQGGYANWFKAKYKQIGPLFQSRYKSVLVEDESYLVTLSAYIHLNPVRAKLAKNAEDYRWSSCKLYFNESKNELIDPGTVLGYAGGIKNYRYILSEMIDESPPLEAIYGKFSILGKESFKEKMLRQKESELKADNRSIDHAAQPEYIKLKSVSIEKIADIVMEVLNVRREMLTAKTRGNIARKLYFLMLKKYTTMKISEIADLAEMKYHTTGELIRSFEKDVKKSKKLQNITEKTKEKIYAER